MGKASIYQRYSDVIFALEVSSIFEVELGRLQLQKLVYLCDILSLVWMLISVKNGHRTNNFGPYDPKIQNAVDSLSFRGFVNVSHLKIVDHGKKVSSKYKITESGLILATNLKSKNYYKTKSEIYFCIAHHIDHRGWKYLKDIVYSEPSYLNKLGHHKKISTNSYFGNDTYRLIEKFNNLKSNDINRLSKSNMVSIFFQITDKYREQSELGYV